VGVIYGVAVNNVAPPDYFSGIKKIISGYELLTVSQLDMVKKLLVIEVQYAQLHLCSF
jgi:hypothetical protein